MRNLNYQLKNLCLRNKDGSYSTQSNRNKILQQIANQLHELGFKQMNVLSLKQKHIERLVGRWKREELSNATIKNRMSILRWWAEKINRPEVIAKDNKHYGIDNRQYVTNVSKAVQFENEQLRRVKDRYVKASLELQRVFGLRREEAIKFNVAYADKGDHIYLKGSWTKGGKVRTVSVRNDEQREVLNRVHKLAGKGSLIPPNKSYVQQMRIYERHTNRAGLNKLHGLRHGYAQRRYKEITGKEPPALGGKVDDKELDLKARLKISQELGHEREQITAVYLGR